MQYDVIVGEAFGFPHAKERIGVKKIAVYCEGDVGAVRCMVFSDIRSKPAFQPPAFVIIGTGTLLHKVISGLESVDEKISDIFSCFGKTSNQFLKIRHALFSPVS